VVQVEASLGEPVFVANRPVAIGRCDEDSLFHEASEPARENVGREGEISLEFVESAGPEEGLSNEHAGPVITHDAQGSGDRTRPVPFQQRQIGCAPSLAQPSRASVPTAIAATVADRQIC